MASRGAQNSCSRTPGPAPQGFPPKWGLLDRGRVFNCQGADLDPRGSRRTLQDADEGLEAELRFLNPGRHGTALVGTAVGRWEHWCGVGSSYLQGWSRLRGAHTLGRVGSLGSREGSEPSQGQAPLGAPVTVGGRREEAWLELPWGAWRSHGSPRAGRQPAVCSQRLTAKAAFAFLTLGLGEGDVEGLEAEGPRLGHFRGLGRWDGRAATERGAEAWWGAVVCCGKAQKGDTLLARMQGVERKDCVWGTESGPPAPARGPGTPGSESCSG